MLSNPGSGAVPNDPPMMSMVTTGKTSTKISTSGSRTAVAEQSGSKSQLTGVVGAATIALILILAPWLMQYVPQPTLGAVVIAAALSLATLAPLLAGCGETGYLGKPFTLAALLGVVRRHLPPPGPPRASLGELAAPDSP